MMVDYDQVKEDYARLNDRIEEQVRELACTDTTGKQKYACNGEFFVSVDVTCPCEGEYSDPEETCEVCGGLGGWIQKEVIPWTTIKDIYKAMINAREL